MTTEGLKRLGDALRLEGIKLSIPYIMRRLKVNAEMAKRIYDVAILFE
jgi:hypothetical protein